MYVHTLRGGFFFPLRDGSTARARLIVLAIVSRFSRQSGRAGEGEKEAERGGTRELFGRYEGGCELGNVECVVTASAGNARSRSRVADDSRLVPRQGYPGVVF